MVFKLNTNEHNCANNLQYLVFLQMFKPDASRLIILTNAKCQTVHLNSKMCQKTYFLLVWCTYPFCVVHLQKDKHSHCSSLTT